MTNNNRDELGRFAKVNTLGGYGSLQELGTAVEALEAQAVSAATATERTAAMNEWFELKRLHEDATKGQVSMPTEWVSRVANSGLTAIPKDANGLRAYYAEIRDELVDVNAPEPAQLRHTVIDLMNSPSLPEDVRDDIYLNAKPAVKASLASAMSLESNPATGLDLLRLIPQDRPEIEPELGQQLIFSRKLTFEQKAAIAARSDLTALLVMHHNAEVTSSAETEAAFVKELSEGKQDAYGIILGDSRQKMAWAALAEHSTRTETHDAILNNFRNAPIQSSSDPVVKLMANPAFTENRALNVLRRTAEFDPAGFTIAAHAWPKTWTGALDNPVNKLREALHYNASGSKQTGRDSVLTPANASVYEERVRSGRDEHERAAAQAHLDATPEGYKELGRGYKRAHKEKQMDVARELLIRGQLANEVRRANTVMLEVNSPR